MYGSSRRDRDNKQMMTQEVLEEITQEVAREYFETFYLPEIKPEEAMEMYKFAADEVFFVISNFLNRFNERAERVKAEQPE